MKLTIIGGGGVRTPLMVNGLIRWHERVNVDRLVLFDTDTEKLNVIGNLVSHLVQEKGSPFQVEVATDLREAVKNADFIYTAIRVGGDVSRVVDEKIPLKYGVLGQETTGPGGFAMALRTIPVMLEYAKIIEEVSPDAWVVNFTNPSGLITEALQKYTNIKIVGICDAPSSMKLEIAKFLKEPADDVYIKYFGLNHLGWINRITVNGEDRLPDIIDRYDEFAKGFPHMSSFSKTFIQQLNMLPNEYLYYYYFREEAVQNIRQSSRTRGEQIVELNKSLLSQVEDCIKKGQLQKALDIYEKILSERTSSYMSNETGSAKSDESVTLESEGYEGLAMSIIEGILHNRRKTLVLNVPNQGVLSSLKDDDVVEVTCLLDSHGPVPLAVGQIPDRVQGLIHSVKEYERLTVSAAVSGNYEQALLALTVHPLVCSYSLAKKILDDYLIDHRAFLPQFRKRSGIHA